MAIKIPETDNYFQYGSCGEPKPCRVCIEDAGNDAGRDAVQSLVLTWK